MEQFLHISKTYDLMCLGIIGSRARGDHGLQSDLDLIGFSKESGFYRFQDQGHLVELHVYNSVQAWFTKPSWWYVLDELLILQDDGTLEYLKSQVSKWFGAYQPLLSDIRKNKDWLEAFIRKIESTKRELKVTYLINTNLWEILSGVFMMNHRPVPANSGMYRMAPKILGEQIFSDLLLSSPELRKKIACQLVNDIIEHHRQYLLLLEHSV